MGNKTYDNRLGRYNESRELHIENRTAGSQAQVSYQGMIRKASVTRAAVHMGVTGTGRRTGYRGACNRPPGQGPDQ